MIAPVPVHCFSITFLGAWSLTLDFQKIITNFKEIKMTFYFKIELPTVQVIKLFITNKKFIPAKLICFLRATFHASAIYFISTARFVSDLVGNLADSFFYIFNAPLMI